MRLTVRLQFTVLLAAIVLINIASGVVIYLQLGHVHDKMLEVNNNWLPGTQMIGEMSADSKRYRDDTGDRLLTMEDKVKEAKEKEMAEDAADFGQARQKLETLLGPGPERELATDIDTKWQAYVGMTEKLIAALKHGQTMEAISGTFVKEMGQAFDAIDQDMSRFVEVENKGGDEAEAQGTQTYQQAMYILIGSVLLDGVMGTLMVAWIMKNITGSLKGLVGATGPAQHRSEQPTRRPAKR